jgi:predicted nucleic acid-binding protein
MCWFHRSFSVVIRTALFMSSFWVMLFNSAFLRNFLPNITKFLHDQNFHAFPIFFLRAEALLAEIDRRAVSYTPTLKLSIIADADDNMILELADVCAADYIITGNTNDFAFPTYNRTKILTPKEFWEAVQ